MEDVLVLELIRSAFEATLILSLPFLLTSLVVGVLVNIFQVVFSVQEQTLTFVPKFIVVAIVLAVLGPWMVKFMTNYTQTLVLNVNYWLGK